MRQPCISGTCPAYSRDPICTRPGSSSGRYGCPLCGPLPSFLAAFSVARLPWLWKLWRSASSLRSSGQAAQAANRGTATASATARDQLRLELWPRWPRRSRCASPFRPMLTRQVAGQGPSNLKSLPYGMDVLIANDLQGSHCPLISVHIVPEHRLLY